MTLRAYQVDAIAKLRDAYASGRRAPLLVMPTGSGKTRTSAEMVRLAVARGRRVAFFAHRAELIEQTVRTLESVGVTNVRTIRAQHDLGDPLAPVVVASVQTLANRMDRLPLADFAILDECHHGAARTFAALVRAYASAQILGLSATPERGDGAPLGDVFDSLVVGATVRELTALGHLVPCRVWAPPIQLESAELGLDVVSAYRLHARGGRAVVFCASVDHCRTVAAELTSAGVVAGVVIGNGPADERARTLTAFRVGTIRVVCSIHVLTEGWDDPGVEVCILARKPSHAGLFLQMAGRVLRPAPGKTEALLIDLCGSVHDHGTPDMDRSYSLDGKAISGVKRDAIRQCPHCGSVFLSAATCPQCGATLAARERGLPTSVGTGVVEVTGKIEPRATPTIMMTAKRSGRCRMCPRWIEVGDRIAWSKDTNTARHANCDLRSAMDAADALLTGAA